MRNKVLVLIVMLLTTGAMSIGATLAFFSDAAVSQNNTFAAAAQFPTATPSVTITPTPIATSTPTPTITPTPSTPPIATTLVMNEILPASSCSSGNTQGQFLELWNGSGANINLQDYKLNDGTTTIAVVNSNTNLPSGSYAILVKSNGVINSCLGTLPEGTVDANLGGNVNLNTGTLQLLDASDNVVDTIKWGPGETLQPTVNQSIERNPTGLDSALGTNFNSADFTFRLPATPGQ